MYFANDLMTRSYANCDSSRWRCIYYIIRLVKQLLAGLGHGLLFTFHALHCTLCVRYDLFIERTVAVWMPDAIAIVVVVVHLAYQKQELSLSHNLIGGGGSFL